MIIAALLLAAGSNAAPLDVVSFRADRARETFRQCLSSMTSDIFKEVKNASAVDAARSFCYIVERDLNAALPMLVERTLRQDGIKSVTPAIVDMLSKETADKMVAEDVETMKAALSSR